MLVGVAGATGSHRFRRRTRPIAFRRHRRVLIPGLLAPAVLLFGVAVVLDGAALISRWEWSVGLFTTFAGVVWIAGGIPGRWRVLPLRLLLVLGILAIPFSGIPFHRAASPVLQRVEIVVGARGDALAVSIERPEGFRVRGEETVNAGVADHLVFSVDTAVRSAPLWWLPPSGTVQAVQLHRDTGEEPADTVSFSRPAVEPEIFAPLEQFLRARGIIRSETHDLRIPDRPGWFLQPGRYRVTIALSGPHPKALSYRYTQQ